MRTYDLSPLYRATVGFDRMSDLMDRVMRADSGTSGGYPPYNIEKSDDHSYRITIAVAGFSQDELNVEMRDAQLTISAKKAETEGEAPTFLHRGIATRAFEKRFQLADHVHVTGAEVADGLLHIDLVREVPEALKPRQIEIGGAKAIEGKKSKKAVTA